MYTTRKGNLTIFPSGSRNFLLPDSARINFSDITFGFSVKSKAK